MSTAVSLPPFFTFWGCHMLYRLHPSHNSSVICVIYPFRVKAPRNMCILLAQLSLTSSIRAQTRICTRATGSNVSSAAPGLMYHPARTDKAQSDPPSHGLNTRHIPGKARPPCFILFIRSPFFVLVCSTYLFRNDGKQIIWAVLLIRRRQRSIASR